MKSAPTYYLVPHMYNRFFSYSIMLSKDMMMQIHSKNIFQKFYKSFNKYKKLTEHVITRKNNIRYKYVQSYLNHYSYLF